MRKSVMTVLAVLAAAAGFGAITGSITTDQGEQKGTIRWSARDKAYAVKGKNGIEVQVKPSDVVEMSINKPDGYDEAVEQVAKGQGAAAIPARFTAFSICLRVISKARYIPKLTYCSRIPLKSTAMNMTSSSIHTKQR